MAIIKRYPNRKLYHTETKAYITLDEIGALIQAGENIHVVDHVTGDDLTTLTLTQIIVEREKQKAGFLPHSILASLVRVGGNTRSTIRRALANSLGFWNQVDDEINRRIDDLVSRGEFTTDEAIRISEKMTSISGRFSDVSPLSDSFDIDQALMKRGVLNREEFQVILAEIEKLSKLLDDMNQ